MPMSYAGAAQTAPAGGTPNGFQFFRGMFDYIFSVYNSLESAAVVKDSNAGVTGLAYVDVTGTGSFTAFQVSAASGFTGSGFVYAKAGGGTFVVNNDATVTAPGFHGPLFGNADTATSATTATTAATATTAINATNAATAAAVAANAIVTASIADANVTTPKIADANVTTPKIADGAVVTSKIPDANITTPKIADGAVTLEKYAEGRITPAGGMSVQVNPLKKWNLNRLALQYSGETRDLTAHLPGPGLTRYVLLEVNSTPALIVKDGDATSGVASYASLQYDADTRPLGFVRLTYGQTTIAPTDILNWNVLSEVDPTGAGSPVGHAHGIGSEQRIQEFGLNPLFPRATAPASMSIYIEAGWYRTSANQYLWWAGGPVGPVGAPASGLRIDTVYFPQDGPNPVIVTGTIDPTTPVAPAIPPQGGALCFIHCRSTMTQINSANSDTTNGWVQDCRVFTGLANAASLSGVNAGGTGVLAFPNSGLVFAPGTGTGVDPLTVVRASTSPILGLGITPTVTPATANADGLQLGGTTVATGTSSFQDFNGVHIIASSKTGSGLVSRNAAALRVEAESIGANNYAAIFNGDVAIIGVTAFPTSPVDKETCYRNDLGSWYRAKVTSGTISTAITGSGAQTVTTTAAHNLVVGDLVTVGANTNVAVTAVPTTTTFTASFGAAVAGSSAYSATGWRQMGEAFHTSSVTAPAAPPTGYRYLNLTDNFRYRWSGVAYQKYGTARVALDYSDSTSRYSGGSIAASGTATLTGTRTFTVEDANSTVILAMSGGVFIGNSSGSVATPNIYAVIAGVQYDFAPLYFLSGNSAYLQGHRTIEVTGLAPGTYNAELFYTSGSAATSLFFTSPSDNAYYMGHIQVIEIKP